MRIFITWLCWMFIDLIDPAFVCHPLFWAPKDIIDIDEEYANEQQAKRLEQTIILIA